MPQLTTPLQYLTIHLLFAGPQTGQQLRHALRAMGVRHTRASFSRLMMRLVEASYVNPQNCVQRSGEQNHCQSRYEVTDLGVFVWLDVRRFYLNLAPPSADLVPVVTEVGELAAYDPKLRKTIVDSHFQKELFRLMMPIAKAALDKYVP
jgi:hypothetical protein